MIPGESDAYFLAGVFTFAGALVSVSAITATYKGKPYVWNLGFLAVSFTSLGTTLGLWTLAGESGWGFLGLSVGLAAGAVLGAKAWGSKWPIPPFKETNVQDKREHDAKTRGCGPGK